MVGLLPASCDDSLSVSGDAVNPHENPHDFFDRDPKGHALPCGISYTLLLPY
ncbi:MAG: hypothetical protein ACI9UK_000473 [Candidatus Krumholzibacteriia bacterium]|jgi:hypothetical protein